MISLDVRFKDLTIGEINLDKTQLATIEQRIFNVQPIVKQKVKENFGPLQKWAIQYITNMREALNTFKQLIYKYNKQLNIINQIQNGSIEAENYVKIKMSQPSTQSVLQLQSKLIEITDEFTIKLFDILGKKLQLVYVYQSNAANVVEIYKIQKIEDLLKLRKTSSGGIEARLKAAKRDLEKRAIKVKKEDYIGNEEQAKKLDNMYKEIIYRYNTYRYDYKEKGRVSLVLWNVLSKPKWHGMFLFQKGDLAQAYANLALNNKNQFWLNGDTNNPPEMDIEYFMQLVEQVDATFGGVQADVENEKTGLALAVKSLSASPQGILDTLVLAQDFLTENITIENFEEYKKEWKKEGRNTILKFFSDTAKGAMEEAFSQLQS